jgi:hypothetical protein
MYKNFFKPRYASSTQTTSATLTSNNLTTNNYEKDPRP